MLVEELAQIEERISSRAITEIRGVEFRVFPNFIIAETRGSSVVLTYNKFNSVPYPDRPNEGIFQISLANRKNDMLLNMLNKIYVHLKCVNMNVIRFNKEVEALVIDIKVVECDGDLYRLCIAGINKIIEILKIHTYFTPRCFGYCSLEKKLISDPTLQELEKAQWRAYVVMKSSREMLLLEKIGEGCSEMDVMEVVDRAYSEVKV
ncbi:hypothetical protein ENBRE01_1065 [Enteropsectra breve]|nr:hypothetical protein ENBRE01_1065 [Enteropsectra breve]